MNIIAGFAFHREEGGMVMQRFWLANEPGSLGLSCKDSGVALAGVPLLRMTSNGYVPRPSDEINALMKAAYLGVSSGSRLMSGLAVVARALNEGNLAKAMVAAVFLKLPELDWDGAVRIAYADDVLSKYDPDEPRDWHGRWTTGGGSGPSGPPLSELARGLEDRPNHYGSPSGSTIRPMARPVATVARTVENDAAGSSRPEIGLLEDAAYQGTYHDQVVAEVADYYRSQGAKVLTEVDLVARNGATARADMIVIPASGEPIILIEVKTGNNPQYTNGQRVVYPMAQIGNHVTSPNLKIMQLGFLPGQWLPPTAFMTIYRQNDNSPYKYLIHPDPLFP